jgi:hypothetical protein
MQLEIKALNSSFLPRNGSNSTEISLQSISNASCFICRIVSSGWPHLNKLLNRSTSRISPHSIVFISMIG